MMVVPEPLADGDSEQNQLIASWKGLKYLPPDLTLLGNLHPIKDMKDFFWKDMEFDQMTDEVMTYLEILA